MVGIFVDDDVVGVPEPVAHIGNIVRGHGPVPITEAEAARIAAGQSPAMFGAEAAFETAVLPRVVDTVMLIVAPGVVTYPAAAVVHVRRIGMAGAVAVIAPVLVPMPTVL